MRCFSPGDVFLLVMRTFSQLNANDVFRYSMFLPSYAFTQWDGWFAFHAFSFTVLACSLNIKFVQNVTAYYPRC